MLALGCERVPLRDAAEADARPSRRIEFEPRLDRDLERRFDERGRARRADAGEDAEVARRSEGDAEPRGKYVCRIHEARPKTLRHAPADGEVEAEAVRGPLSVEAATREAERAEAFERPRSRRIDRTRGVQREPRVREAIFLLGLAFVPLGALLAIDVVLAMHVLVGREADAPGIHRQRDARRPNVEAEDEAQEMEFDSFDETEANPEEDALELHARARLGAGDADDAAIVATDRRRGELDSERALADQDVDVRVAVRSRDRKIIRVAFARDLRSALEARERRVDVLRVDDPVDHHVAAGEVLVRSVAARRCVLEAAIALAGNVRDDPRVARDLINRRRHLAAQDRHVCFPVVSVERGLWLWDDAARCEEQ